MISPDECRQKAHKQCLPALERAEKMIDSMLLDTEIDGRPHTIDSHELNLPIVMREGLLAKYRAKGWHVEIVSDQRDGDFIRFT